MLHPPHDALACRRRRSRQLPCRATATATVSPCLSQVQLAAAAAVAAVAVTLLSSQATMPLQVAVQVAQEAAAAGMTANTALSLCPHWARLQALQHLGEAAWDLAALHPVAASAAQPAAAAAAAVAPCCPHAALLALEPAVAVAATMALPVVAPLPVMMASAMVTATSGPSTAGMRAAVTMAGTIPRPLPWLPLQLSGKVSVTAWLVPWPDDPPQLDPCLPDDACEERRSARGDESPRHVRGLVRAYPWRSCSYLRDTFFSCICRGRLRTSYRYRSF